MKRLARLAVFLLLTLQSFEAGRCGILLGMDEVLHANIFFFITSVAVILFTLLLCVALYHGIKILQSVRRIVERIDAGSEMIVEDVEQLRSYVLDGSLLSQLFGMFTGRGRRSRSTSKRGARVTITDEE